MILGTLEIEFLVQLVIRTRMNVCRLFFHHHPNVRDKYRGDWEQHVLFASLGTVLVGITLIFRIKVRDREYCFNFSWI